MNKPTLVTKVRARTRVCKSNTHLYLLQDRVILYKLGQSPPIRISLPPRPRTGHPKDIIHAFKELGVVFRHNAGRRQRVT